MVIFGLCFSWNWLVPLDFNGSIYSFNKIEVIMKIDYYLPEVKFIKWETVTTMWRTCFYTGFTVFSKRNSVVFMKGFILNKETEKYSISKDVIIKNECESKYCKEICW